MARLGFPVGAFGLRANSADLNPVQWTIASLCTGFQPRFTKQFPPPARPDFEPVERPTPSIFSGCPLDALSRADRRRGAQQQQRRAGRAVGQPANGEGGQPLQQKTKKENRVDRQSPQAEIRKKNRQPEGTDDPPMTNFPQGERNNLPTGPNRLMARRLCLAGAIWVAAITARRLCIARCPAGKASARCDIARRLPTKRRGLRRLPRSRGGLLCLSQQLRRRHPKTIGEQPQRPHADVPFPTLGITDVVSAHPGQVGERFLRQLALVA